MAARYEAYKDEVGEWRWRSIASNGEQIGKSSEGYTRMIGAIESISIEQSIKDVVVVPDPTFKAEPGDDYSLRELLDANPKHYYDDDGSGNDC